MKNLYIIVKGDSEVSKLNTKIKSILGCFLNKINETGIIAVNYPYTNKDILNIALSTCKEKENFEYVPTVVPNVVLGGLEIIYGTLLQKIKKLNALIKETFEEYSVSSSNIEEFKEKFTLFSDKLLNIFTYYSDISEIDKKLGKEDIILYIGNCPNEFRKEVEEINKVSEETYYCISESAESSTMDDLILKLNEA